MRHLSSIRFYWTSSWLLHLAIIIRHTNPAWLLDMMGEVYLVCAHWFCIALVQLLNKNTPSIYLKTKMVSRSAWQLNWQLNGTEMTIFDDSERVRNSTQNRMSINVAFCRKKYHSYTEYSHICKFVVPCPAPIMLLRNNKYEYFLNVCSVCSIQLLIESNDFFLFLLLFSMSAHCTMHMLNCNPIWELAYELALFV